VLFSNQQGQKTTPLSFISLLNDSIQLTKNSQKRPLPNNLRKYPQFPAVKIGRLGVQKVLQGHSLGTFLINLVKQIFTTNNRTGCRFITVDVYNNPLTIKFYKKNDFDFLHELDEKDKTRIMYYDLKRFQNKKNKKGSSK